jgi:Phage tail protein (Tail_P2_I)
MPMPDLDSWAADLYDRLTPIASQDAALGWPLANYCAAIGTMFQTVEDYARDQMVNGQIAPGWSQLLDPLRCPVEALPWLGMFVGVVVNQALSEDDQRAQIQAANGWARGTLGAMVAAAQAYLTGTQTVLVRERDPSACPSLPAYGITFITKDGETPDPMSVQNALLAAKPAGLILQYLIEPDVTYEDLYDDYATYELVYTTFHTYKGVLTNTSGV